MGLCAECFYYQSVKKIVQLTFCTSYTPYFEKIWRIFGRMLPK